MTNRSLRFLGIGLVVGACASTTARNLETGMAKALVSTDEENKIGLQLKTELETKQGVVYLSDGETVTYVRGVANKVIAIGKKDRPEVQWQVFVIDDRKTVNAFATPGGYLYVYRGLLEMAQNEAELAAVMAHETGHVVARHAARNLVTAYGLDAVTALAAGNNPGLLAKITTGVAGKGVMLAHSRADETEADELGARYTAAAGYDPHAFITFFQRLQKSEGASPKLLSYLSDHPATGDRIDHLGAFIASQHLAGSNLGVSEYGLMKTHLLTLPTAAPATGQSGAPAGAPPPAARPPAAPPPR